MYIIMRDRTQRNPRQTPLIEIKQELMSATFRLTWISHLGIGDYPAIEQKLENIKIQELNLSVSQLWFGCLG